ncbi:MAG: hypothetical protein UE295_10215, partial [Acutalibacteraceae bacterium]|nr:hypothetical protein [Acutalibacteraceae bacterium]
MSAINAFATETQTVSSGSFTPTPYDGVPVTPQKVSESNYAKLGFTSSNWRSYKGWFAIRDAKELYGYANLVNSSPSNNSLSAVLMNDIIVNSGTVTENGSSSGTTYHWPVIYGNKNHMSTFYAGNFDGNGHYISGLYCKSSSSRIGFIGECEYRINNTIKGLTIKNSYFKGGGAGAIVSRAGNKNNIINCRVMSDVTVVGSGRVGGIVGSSVNTPISYCVSFTTGTGGESNGAIVGVGASGENITSCYTSKGSHVCENIAVDVKETVATCLYGGVTEHSYCLVCDKVILGTKTVTAPTDHQELTTANCKAPATCTACGVTTGEKNTSNHTSDETYFEYVDDNTHKEYYSCCKQLKTTTSHTEGDKATCGERAYCYDCSNYYGTPDKNNHTTEDVNIAYVDDKVHNEYYTCCNALKSKVEHTADRKATCLAKTHCDACDNDFGDVDITNHVSEETYVETIDGKYHGIYASCCNTLKEKVEHTSTGDSSANCTGIATCDICGVGYGSKDSTNHTGKLVKVNYDSYTGQHRAEWDCCGAYEKWEKHSYVYTVNEETNRIEANCPDCSAFYSVGITVPTDAVYNGESIAAVCDGEIKGIYSRITYSTDDGYAPVDAGTHTATITLGDATISESFTISPKEISIAYIETKSQYYDGTSTVIVNDVTLDDIVCRETPNWTNNWTRVYDDVYIDASEITATVADSVAGYYDVARISGQKLSGKAKHNYVLKPVTEVEVYGGHYIEEYVLNITIHNQHLKEGEELDNTAYTLDSELPDNCELVDVVLAKDESTRYIYIEDCKVVKDGVDVTNCFYINSTNGVYAVTCLNHNTSDNGVCPNCDTYEPAKVSQNEWSELVYKISNAGQLMWFAEQCNLYYAQGHAKLVTDINLNPGYTFNSDGTYLKNGEETNQAPLAFIPIGNNEGMAYSMDFDGNGHTISGIYINRPDESFVGLFGKTDYQRTIKNLHISNSYICGNSQVAAIAGYGSTIFDKCSVDETVFVTGNYTVGAIVGNSFSGHIKNSWSRANIASDNYADGGIVGVMDYGVIENSYTTHYNIVDYSDGATITNCYYYNEPANNNGGIPLEDFASGEIAYLLQAGVPEEDIYDDDWNYIDTITPFVWGQKIGTDKFPVINGDKVYYGYKDCNATEKTYCNNNAYDEIPTHSFENGNCTICGDKDPDAKLVSICGDINLALEETEANIFTGITELPAGTYKFNVDDNGTIRGMNFTYTDTATIDYSAGYKAPSTFKATGGRYTFTYNATAKKLTIKFKSFEDIV